jgi:hypothetical protein
MTVSPIETAYEPAVGSWIDFTNLTCDLCAAVWPPNGLSSEHPLVIFEARGAGWSVLPIAGLVCCPDCHERIVNGGTR